MKCQTRNKHHFLELLLAASLGTYNCSTQQQSSPTYAADTATDIKYDATLETSNISQPQLTDTSDTNTSDTFSSQIDTTTQIDLPTLISQDTLGYDTTDNSTTDTTPSETLTPTSNLCKTVNGYIVIPDKNLESAVKEQLGIAKDKEISLEDTKNVTKFDLVGKKIYKVEGLECFANLENLDLYDNYVIDVKPLENLKKLKIVYLRHNKVQNIESLANLTELHVLYLGYNLISDISPVKNLPNLQELSVEDNPLVYEPNVCTIVKQLQLKGTKVYGFDFSKCL